MKTELILTAAMMLILSGAALAVEKATVFNNRGQVTASIHAVSARPVAAPVLS